MRYKDYLELGFERTELDCPVEKNNTGYGGYCLEKRINKGMLISVHSSELESPKLYINKGESDNYHIITVSGDFVKDLLK
jgi:hypothetical protein